LTYRAAAAALVVLFSWPAVDSGRAGIGTVANAGKVRAWAVQDPCCKVFTEDQAVAMAKRFDVITEHWQTLHPYVGQMRAANPQLLLFVYMNGTFTYKTDLTEAAYAHDADGKRISTLSRPITWLLEPTAPEAITYQERRADGLLKVSGYDGLYLDLLGPAALSLTYVTSLPVNPATGEVWTSNDWMKATTSLAAGLRERFTPRPIFCNGLRNGGSYFNPGFPTEQLFDSGIEGCIPEAWLRAAIDPITTYPTESVWKKNVDMLVDAGARGASVMVMTKTWTSGTVAQKDAWYKFALASYLLGNDGRAWFSFSYEPKDAKVGRRFNRIFLGAATGAYAKVNGVYQRTFTGGRALVNPTNSTFAIQLGGTYSTLEGALVTSVTLGPKTAEILKNA
jgi:hypothetical protein